MPRVSSASWTAHRAPDSPPAAPVRGIPRGSRGSCESSFSRRAVNRTTAAGVSTLLPAEHLRRPLVRRLHVIQHSEPNLAQPSGGRDRRQRTGTAVGAGAAAHPGQQMLHPGRRGGRSSPVPALVAASASRRPGG